MAKVIGRKDRQRMEQHGHIDKLNVQCIIATDTTDSPVGGLPGVHSWPSNLARRCGSSPGPPVGSAWTSPAPPWTAVTPSSPPPATLRPSSTPLENGPTYWQ